MCVAQTSRRRRKQMKLDKRYGGWRKSITARARRQAEAIRKQKEMEARKGSSNKSKNKGK